MKKRLPFLLFPSARFGQVKENLEYEVLVVGGANRVKSQNL